MEALINVLKETYASMSETLTGAGPKILATVIVVVAGLLVARTAKALVHQLLKAVSFERASEKMGITDVLKRADVSQTASAILCTLIYWTFLLFTGLVALGTLGIASAETFAAVGALIPSVIIAVAILVLGLNVSAFLAKLIQTAAVNAEVRQGRLVRNAVHYAMSTLVVILAVQQLGISDEILGTAFLIFFGATCLAMALAFGLGSREWAGNIVKSRWKDEQSQSDALSKASELGNEIFPAVATTKKRSRRRTAA